MVLTGITFVVMLLGVAISYFSGSHVVGLTMLVLLVGLPVVGTVVTIDDDLPGGWSNPDGDIPPPWTLRPFWAELARRGLLSGIGFVTDAVWGLMQGAL